jgi:hypothetical protein
MGIPFRDGAIAFALTAGAGMCTCLGAAVVYFPSLVSYANNKVRSVLLSVITGPRNDDRSGSWLAAGLNNGEPHHKLRVCNRFMYLLAVFVYSFSQLLWPVLRGL